MANFKNGGRAAKVSKTRSAKKKSNRKKHPGLRKAFLVIFIVCCIGVLSVGAVGGYVYKFAVNYIEGDRHIDLDEYKANQAQTSIIYGYDANGDVIELLRLHGVENRMWINIKEVPDCLVAAFKDLEDKRFDEHQGVDWERTIGGVIKSKFRQGGSTITQQLIKNLTGENGRTVSRKFYEILNALNLEKFYSKNTIMESYLNTVYLGNGCYGIKTAAEKYFGKEVKNLNAAESAVLAAITKAPYTYDPFLQFEDNISRQQYCLKCMYTEGDLTRDEYEEALDYEVILTNNPKFKGSEVKHNKDEEDNKEYTTEDVKEALYNSDNYSYYLDYVIDNVIEDLREEYGLTANEASKKVFTGGLRIYAAVDLEAQHELEDVYVNRKTFVEQTDSPERPAAQSAMTIMDYSGRVVAICGGAGEKTTFRGLNRATDSPRQPGSSIKPLSVYGPAIEDDIITWSTKVQNYALKRGSSRWPHNYGGSFGSPDSFVTVQYAVAQSLNTVPAQIMNKMGLKRSLDFLTEDLHFTHLVTDENNPKYDGNMSSLCVGGMSYGVTTLEMASGFAIFGNNGYYFKPYSYYKVTNNDGSEVILSSEKETGEEVLSEATAGVMRNIMKTVMTSGTGNGYGISGFETFAKTGTTSDNNDRWFVGGTEYYIAAVWYGYDIPRPITNVGGSNPAGKIWREVMSRIHQNLDSSKEFPTPSGMVARSYCTSSGDLARSGCGTSTGYYKASNLPASCSNCAMLHALGAEIGAAYTGAPTKESESTTEESEVTSSTTLPRNTNNNQTTLPRVPSTTAKVTPTSPPPQPTVPTPQPTTPPVTEPQQVPEDRDSNIVAD